MKGGAAVILLSALSVLTAYLLGSIPSAYIVGRLLKNVDMREVGDGRIGASYSFRRLGFIGGLVVIIMDVGKGVAAVWLARILSAELVIILMAALAVVVGHNWSIFMRFKGGKGAATTYGALAALIFWQLIIGLSIAGIVYFLTHKPGLSTGVMFGMLPLVLWMWGLAIMVVIFPVFLSLPMVLKHRLMIRNERRTDSLSL
ncbi:glycerol-3-phosphate acyltransferase [Chloroflexota bacterium]